MRRAASTLVLIALALALLPNAVSAAQAGGNPNVKDAGSVTIDGQNYPVKYVLAQPATPQSSVAATPPNQFPGTAGPESQTVFWQFGSQWQSSSTYYGGKMTVTYFDGQSNSNGFAFWFGLNDNKGKFYQDGLEYWGPSVPWGCYQYTGWAVDNNNGGSLTTSNCWWNIPPDQFAINAVDSGSIDVAAFVYKGQWYFSFTGNVQQSGAFPNGADQGTSVSGKVGEILEGWSSTGYTSGNAIVTNLEYVWNVALVNGVLTISVWYTNNLTFYKTANGGNFISPPSTSNWFVANAHCPYSYETYFTSNTGSLPPSGSSQPVCVP